MEAVKFLAQVDDADAKKALADNKGDPGVAIDVIFARDPAISKLRDGAGATFTNLASGGNSMTTDEFLAFAESAELDVLRPEWLAFAARAQAVKEAQFTRAEFTRGFASLGVETVAQFKSKGVLQLTGDIQLESDFFKRVLARHSFAYLLQSTNEYVRALDVEMALAGWKLLVGEWRHFDAWKQFVTCGGVEDVSADLWAMLFEFVRVHGDDPGSMPEENSWPLAIEHFVECFKEGRFDT